MFELVYYAVPVSIMPRHEYIFSNQFVHICCAEKIIEPVQKGSKTTYYHRRYRRVPTIDECEIGDPVCYFEANEQFKRDRLVE